MKPLKHKWTIQTSISVIEYCLYTMKKQFPYMVKSEQMVVYYTDTQDCKNSFLMELKT